MSPKKVCEGSDHSSEHKHCRAATSGERSYIEGLLMGDSRARLGRPLTAGELLPMGGKALEPLFHEPPVGPMPEYLTPHGSVHGCVAEYEEKLEEMDRWKALALSRWLNERVGHRWCIAGKVYELRAVTEDAGASQKYWLGLIGDPTEGGKPITNES